MTTKFQAAIDAYHEADKLLRQIDAADIHAAFVEAFQDAPKVAGFTWVQYTPYFNDGDPCVFRATTEDGARSMLDPVLAPTTSAERETQQRRRWGSSGEWTWLHGRAPTVEEIEQSQRETPRVITIPSPDSKHTYMSNYLATEYLDPGFNLGMSWNEARETYDSPPADPEDVRQTARVNSLFGSLPDDLQERVFGDHCVVFVWRHGIGTRGYSHE